MTDDGALKANRGAESKPSEVAGCNSAVECRVANPVVPWFESVAACWRTGMGNPETRQERAMAEAWRKLKPGDRVRVALGISEMERRLAGREFVIDRFAQPHGYAVVKDEHGPWWVHPEALEKIDG